MEAAVKIASWNVNSVKVRLPHLLDFLKNAQPDVLCLQEIKCLADDFPRLEVASLGYKVEALGSAPIMGSPSYRKSRRAISFSDYRRRRRRPRALYRGDVRAGRCRGARRLDLS